MGRQSFGVNGKDYMLSDSNGNGEIKETCIGKAKPYIIDVPTRQNNIGSNDILWTVNGDKNKLIAVKAGRNFVPVYSTGRKIGIHKTNKSHK